MPGSANDPLHLLIQSFERAGLNGDPNAKFCTLTTLDEVGFPVSRTVTVRHLDYQGILVYINSNSPKVEQLTKNARYELLFFWSTLLQQYRIRGSYQIFDNESQRSSWLEKPYAGKLYDLFQTEQQKQSSVLGSRQNYEQQALELKRQYPPTANLEMPAELQTIRFRPDYIESWTGSMKDGLHDRRLYRLTDQAWHCDILVP